MIELVLVLGDNEGNRRGMNAEFGAPPNPNTPPHHPNVPSPSAGGTGGRNDGFVPEDARSQASRASWRRRSLADGQSLRSYSAMSGHFAPHGPGHGLALPRPGQSPVYTAGHLAPSASVLSYRGYMSTFR